LSTDELRLRVVGMPTRKPRSSSTLSPRQRRTAWWLLALREVSGKTQKEVYPRLGFKAASSLSDLERGVTAASLEQLEVLAEIYQVPITLLVAPPATDEERITQLRAGRPIDPDDVLIPLSVLRRLGQEALAELASGDTRVLRGEPEASGAPPAPASGAVA
jgi:transcriptional regulator with XRE-family HTH domain